MLSLTLVALSREWTLWLEMDMWGASAEGECKRYVVSPSSDMQSLRLSWDKNSFPLLPGTPPLTHSNILLFPKWGIASTTSLLLLSSLAILASRVLPPTHSTNGEWEMGLRGWFGACYTVIKWECLGESRRRRWSIMFCCAFHCSIVAFLFLSGQTLMLYPLTFCGLGSHVS